METGSRKTGNLRGNDPEVVEMTISCPEQEGTLGNCLLDSG